MQKTVEVIPTGLTAGYVEYWTIRQGIKEAVQNIVYGAVKSNKEPNFWYRHGFGYVEDQYTGFEKRYLYLGESKQRDDADGLGNFGEGWKLFLLIAARNGLKHRVDTVGFSFYGEMVDTNHGVQTLHIIIEPNDREVGTKVMIECSQEDFIRATSSFAVIAGIDVAFTRHDMIYGDREGELWINGVLVEQDDNRNPLNLHFSYNLTNRNLVNRDRSQVNTKATYEEIRMLWSMCEDDELIEKYIRLAKDGVPNVDIQNGPRAYVRDKDRWVKLFEKVYGRKQESLVLPSRNADIDKEAVYRGYTLLQLPDSWAWTLEVLGFKSATSVVKMKRVVEPVAINAMQKKILSRAKTQVRKCLGLKSVNELPRIEISDKLNDHNTDVIKTEGLYDFEDNVIYLHVDVLKNEVDAVRVLLHEALHWKTNAADSTHDFVEGFGFVALRLLGYKV